MNKDPYYELARKRVKEKKKFKELVASTLGVGAFLLGINLFITPGFLWAFFPIAGMLLGVIIQGLRLYGPLATVKDSEQDEIEREYKRLRGRGDEFDRSEDEQLDLDENRPLKMKKLEKQWDENDLV